MKRKKIREKSLRIVTRLNKSRAGDYVYINDDYGTGLYKYREGTKLDPYYLYYMDTHNKRRKKKGSLKAYLESFEQPIRMKAKVSKPLKTYARRYVSKLRKRQLIDENINKGITSYTLPNIHSVSEPDIKNAYRECLKPLVLDSSLLNLLLQESNMEKLQHRFEFKAKFYNEDNKILITERKVNYTLRKFIQDIKENFKLGMTFHNISNSRKTLASKNYASEEGETKQGTLKRVECTMIFRRG